MWEGKPDCLPYDDSQSHRGDEDHQQGSESEWLDDHPLEKDAEPTRHPHGQDDQEGNKDEGWDGRSDPEILGQAVKDKDDKGAQDANVSMRKVNHIQSAEKEAESDCDQGIRAANEQGVHHLLKDLCHGPFPLSPLYPAGDSVSQQMREGITVEQSRELRPMGWSSLVMRYSILVT